jgi:hypothetical protein
MYEVSVSHISTNFSCQNKLFYKNLYGFHAEGIYEWRGGDRVPNPRWTTIPNFIWVFDQPRLKPTIYYTRGKQANHYTTDVVI